METLKLINGNKQAYLINLPRLVMLTREMNLIALQHITENTGLVFTPCSGGYEAQPETALQIAALFLTYNFKTRYYNNGTVKNTLYLKNDHHTGFDVDSICLACCKHNHIYTHDLSENDRLAC